MLQCFQILESKLYGKPENQKENEGTCVFLCTVWQDFMLLPLSIILYIADIYATPLNNKQYMHILLYTVRI